MDLRSNSNFFQAKTFPLNLILTPYRRLLQQLLLSRIVRASSVCLPKKGVVHFADVILVHFQGGRLECTIIANVDFVHPGRLAWTCDAQARDLLSPRVQRCQRGSDEG